MTLFELLFFLLVCLALGFIAHLIFPAWGWWVGAIPALALCVVMAFFTVFPYQKKKPQANDKSSLTQ